MKLLLRRDVPRLGFVGDVVEVTAGYARNYLIPHRIAVEPSAANIKAIEEEKKRAAAERKARREALEDVAKRLEGVEVMISAAANPEGRLYGSVGPREIAAALRDEGHPVEAAHVQCHDTIRELGNRMVPIVFTDDLRTEVKVWVVQEKAAGDLEGTTESDAAAKPADAAEGMEAIEDGGQAEPDAHE
jgi:large subunit ribosomal protein L9